MNAAGSRGPGRVVLVADDDPQILRLVRMTLEIEGYSVISASTGEEAVAECIEHGPDVAVLDLGMPDFDGLETMHRIREHNPSLPVIILTGRASAQDVTRSLDSGADDYVTKPFHPDVLTSRIGAILRRTGNLERETFEGEPLRYDRVLIDVANRKVEVEGEEVRFSPTEWDLLNYLAMNPGKVMLRTELITRVWGAEFQEEHHRLRLSVSRLRNKLEENPDDPKIITTIRGIGYRMEAPGGTTAA
jgi:two-component system, OmpR family, KDP operon response regulator KdpE